MADFESRLQQERATLIDEGRNLDTKIADLQQRMSQTNDRV